MTLATLSFALPIGTSVRELEASLKDSLESLVLARIDAIWSDGTYSHAVFESETNPDELCGYGYPAFPGPGVDGVARILERRPARRAEAVSRLNGRDHSP